MDPEAVSRDAFALYDANKDGAIAEGELEQCPGLKQGLQQFDRDRDGRISESELVARILQFQKDRIGVMGFIGNVTLSGKPLVGADVALIPEKFMGQSAEPAHAKTGPDGDFRPETEGIPAMGARPGIYRISISKKDASGNETVPSKYNTATTLGMTLAADSPVLNTGIELHLKDGK